MFNKIKKWHFIIIGITLYASAILAIGAIEKASDESNIKSFADSLWYAIVTLTTVGYGDFFPVTPLGKIIGLLLIIGSIGILGYIIGEITNRINAHMEKKKNGFWGTDFEGHYLIVGWSNFGKQVAQQILNAGHKIAFVVNSKNDIELIKDVFPDEKVFCMFADYSNIDAYEKVNIHFTKAVYIDFPEDSETLVFVLNLKKHFPDITIVVTCQNSTLKEAFHNAGIKYVVAQNEVTSRMVASYIFEPQVATYTEDLISTSITDSDFDIQQYKVIKENKLINSHYIDAFWEIKEKYNSVSIGLVVDGNVNKSPNDKYVIKEGDYFILISNGESKKRIEQAFGVNEGI